MSTVEENRRQRLILLEKEFGTQVALAEKIGKSPAQISQWKNASKYSGSEKRRVMDRSTARHIEKMTGKPEGWLDQPIQTVVSASPVEVATEVLAANVKSLLLSKRLQLAMKEVGISQAELARACGVKPPSVHGWLSGKSKFLRGENLLAAARALNVSQEWLATGKGPMLLELRGEEIPGSQGNEDVVQQPTDDEFVLVPQLDISAACGEGRFADHVVVKGGLAFKRSSLRNFGVPERAARIIYALGGSMSPTIQDGCVVLLNTADVTPREGKVYAICTPDGGLVLKRLIWDYHPAMGSQTWIMRSDNPDKIAHPDKVLPPDTRTMIVGRAIWNDNRL